MSCKEGSCNCRKGDRTSGQMHSPLIRIAGDSSGFVYPFPANGLIIEDQPVQVRFKGNRKAWYRAAPGWMPVKDDMVIVETEGGYDLGCVTLTGERAGEANRRGMGKNGMKPGRILRRAGESDLRNWLMMKRKEREVLAVLRKSAGRIDPEMEIRDVEFRSDGRKFWIYYEKGNSDSVGRVAQKAGSMIGIRAEMVKRDLPENSLIRHSHGAGHGGWNKPSQARGRFSPL